MLQTRRVVAEMGARDLSQQTGNLTHALTTNYQRIMAAMSPQEMVEVALEVVRPTVGHGTSTDNFKKLEIALRQAERKGLVAVQHTITNFMLAGQGLSVGRGQHPTRESAEIDQIASMITEDIWTNKKWTDRQLALKELVESCTNFKVMLV